MRSAFYLLPRDKSGFELEDGTPLSIDFMDPQAWFDFALS